MFISLVSAVRDRGKYTSFCCRDFFMTFVNCRFIFMFIFN